MSELIEVKSVELIGPALDWAVAKSEGLLGPIDGVYVMFVDSEAEKMAPVWIDTEALYSPSTDGMLGIALIEKHKPWLSPPAGNDEDDEPYGWDAELYDATGFEIIAHSIGAPTALIAVCRAIVLAKLGAVISVPKELAP